MHRRIKELDPSTQAVVGQTHSSRPCADLNNVDTKADVLFEYFLSHTKFVHLAAWMPNLDKLCNTFCMAEQTDVQISVYPC